MLHRYFIHIFLLKSFQVSEFLPTFQLEMENIGDDFIHKIIRLRINNENGMVIGLFYLFSHLKIIIGVFYKKPMFYIL